MSFVKKICDVSIVKNSTKRMIQKNLSYGFLGTVMNRYLIKKNQLIAVFVFFIEIVGAIILTQTNTDDVVLKKIGWIAILYCLLSVITLYYVKKEFDIFLVFMVLSYLFSFGQCILVSLGYNLGVFAFSMARGFFSNKEILDASAFSLSAISLTGMGFCFYVKKDCYIKTKKQPTPNSHSLHKVAWWLLAISLIPTFYCLCNDITTVFSVGYQSTLENTSAVYKVCVLLSGFYTSAILVLYCFEEKKRIIVYIALGIYVVMQLLGGSRIEVFRLAIVLLIISILFRKEINKKNVLFIFLLMLIGMYVFSFVSSVRNYLHLVSNLNIFLQETANDLMKNNFIFSAIKEMGNTQVINTLVFNLCPLKVEYRYGLSFARLIYSIFPNILKLRYISVDEVFSKYYTVTNAGCGASFIAEGYWNFGYLSVFFFPILGYIWAILSNRFKRQCNEKYVNPESIFLIIYLMYFMVFLVRSESIELGRSFVYYALVPVLISKMLQKKKISKKIKT